MTDISCNMCGDKLFVPPYSIQIWKYSSLAGIEDAYFEEGPCREIMVCPACMHKFEIMMKENESWKS